MVSSVRFTILLFASTTASVSAFIPSNVGSNNKSLRVAETSLEAHKIGKWFSTVAVVATLTAGPVFADDIGRETEAPTMFTGETLQICVKRGPLGACQKTVTRTAENDNDKAKKYFKDPEMMVRQKKDAEAMANEAAGNELIQKLREQSVENKEKNDLTVMQKTMLNDQSASFGPFDRQVVILNTDGRTFSLLENPQAMRLKKAGFIEDRKFVKQPTTEELTAALESPEMFGGMFKGIFGEE
eukprot:CAMPEP_0202476404 /NCGR_PEP_ID=MMETSP1360-20130828/93407_1 /ASSEMBLY_ACC=CAM_ASM_000848 /TAXON_ID=515479 /ORGANISM="Licmophora paradoxa, Strain CCMP2313" /LENGTH=241 /DNA_ID=CAMNT_0049103609 /DNA_START=20 /DNA_END=745 /DNA_ORIENTATION=-